MAVRSSPRLQAMFSSCPSGKQAVFVPRVTKINSVGTLRNKGERNLNKHRDVRKPGQTLKSSRGEVSKSLSVSRDSFKKGNNVSGRVGFPQTCTSRKSSKAESSQADIQRDLKTTSPKSLSKKTSQNATGSGDMSDTRLEVDSKQQKHKGLKTSSSSSTAFQPRSSSSSDCRDAECVMGGATTTLNVKRKRGRPPKHTTKGCKKIKTRSNDSSYVSPSDDNTVSLRSNVSGQVIDLTCENETISEEVDISLFAPSSSTNPNLIQRKVTQFLPNVSSKLSRCLEDNFSSVLGAGGGIDTLTGDSDCFRTSLHSDESVAQLFDLTCKYDLKDNDCTNDNKTLTIPSLKRSRDVLVPLTIDDESLSLEQGLVWSLDSSEAMEYTCTSSPTEEEYPLPSTPQQKLMRKLARQKQLEEMRAKEAAFLREERLLRRKGILPKSTAAQSQTRSSKRISWKDETDLVELFIYSPVHDDDEDTVSIHSDDPNSMEVTLPV